MAYEWTYGAVYSPKWVKGLTLSADWWHIDMRDIVAARVRKPSSWRIPRPRVFSRTGRLFSVLPEYNSRRDWAGPILVIDPSDNISGAILEGLDYEAIYILDSTIFGGSDWGRITTTVNGTWLSRFEFQAAPDTKRFGIAGYIPAAGICSNQFAAMESG